MKSRGEGKNTSSNNIVSTLLKEMGGERKQVYVIGNTNVPLTIGNYIKTFITMSGFILAHVLEALVDSYMEFKKFCKC